MDQRARFKFDAFLHEYDKLRDEINLRIDLQNRMAERSLQLTVLMMTVITALFGFFMKDFITQSPLTYEERLRLFVSASVPILIVHAILQVLTVAAWIYQLTLAFRIHRYLDWFVVKQLSGIEGNDEVFVYQRCGREPDWTTPSDSGLTIYFQAAFQYCVAGLGVALLAVAVIWRQVVIGQYDTLSQIGIGCLAVTALLLAMLVVIHFRAIKHTREFNVSQLAE